MAKNKVSQKDLDQYRRHNIGQSLMEVARHFQRHAIDGFAAEGYKQIQGSHQAILNHLSLSGTRLTVLAERAAITKQAMGQLVDEVERLGFVERVRDPLDGRAKIVKFTAKGHALMKAGTRVGTSVQQEYSALIGEKKMQRLHDLLDELYQEIRKEQD
jgi:DNA-binding MarR family transcriptional regulator